MIYVIWWAGRKAGLTFHLFTRLLDYLKNIVWYFASWVLAIPRAQHNRLNAVSFIVAPAKSLIALALRNHERRFRYIVDRM